MHKEFRLKAEEEKKKKRKLPQIHKGKKMHKEFRLKVEEEKNIATKAKRNTKWKS